MLRLVTTAILLICLLAGSICASTDNLRVDRHDDSACSLAVGHDLATPPCDGSDGGPHGSHCCDTHSHLPAITGHRPVVTHPTHDKQFTAVIPHLIPQDFAHIPFIPPRTLS